ncbi:MAG: crossover junction endodeoxyribonuclease RuvC [Clostridia bacterium]|nr:crossover junction endodeoxyribonuclease RuvC [Clostridia bacterium]
MVILGIDPGYGIIGYGVINSVGHETKVIDCGVIETTKDTKFIKRLNMISEGIIELIDNFKPDCACIEELFFQHNQKTAIMVAEARGVILNELYKKVDNIFEYTPMQIKQILTGNGRADKKQIQYMVTKILGLNKIPKPDDAADALACALCLAGNERNSDEFRIK